MSIEQILLADCVGEVTHGQQININDMTINQLRLINWVIHADLLAEDMIERLLLSYQSEASPSIIKFFERTLTRSCIVKFNSDTGLVEITRRCHSYLVTIPVCTGANIGMAAIRLELACSLHDTSVSVFTSKDMVHVYSSERFARRWYGDLINCVE